MGKDRFHTVKKLVSYTSKLEDIQNELRNYPWDYEGEAYTFTKLDLKNVLEKCINKELSKDDICEWANTIEGRDDIDFETKSIEDIIYMLANPELEGEVTDLRCKELIKILGLG